MKHVSLLLSFLTISICSAHAQGYDANIDQVASSSSYDTIFETLEQFEALGVKELGTTAQENTLEWIIEKYQSYGYTDIVEDPFSYAGNSTSNVIVTKTGCKFPNKFVIIDGHYDTKNGPGTNDNGSGTAIILEAARLLKDVETDYSIRFIHFSGEEDGLKGSYHYVNNVVVPQNMDIKVVFNIDEVGGVAGMVNNTIVCERDESPPTASNSQSSIYTNELANCVSLYSNLESEISNAYASDYMSFQAQEYVITGFFEKNYSPHAHTATDILANMDPVYVHEVSKAAIGGLLHFAQVCSTAGISVPSNKKTKASKLIKVVDLMGREVKVTKNTPLLLIYSDGKVERLFISE